MPGQNFIADLVSSVEAWVEAVETEARKQYAGHLSLAEDEGRLTLADEGGGNLTIVDDTFDE